MTREKLNLYLHKYCDNVYFQPPTNTSISYPCIIYSKDEIDIEYGDNITYKRKTGYQIIYITRDPDDLTAEDIIDNLIDIPHRWENNYISENLYHNVFKVFI